MCMTLTLEQGGVFMPDTNSDNLFAGVAGSINEMVTYNRRYRMYRVLNVAVISLVLLGMLSCGHPFGEYNEFLNASTSAKYDAIIHYLSQNDVDIALNDPVLEFIAWGISNHTSKQLLDNALGYSDFHKFMKEAVFILYNVSSSSAFNSLDGDEKELASTYYSLLFESIMFSDEDISGLSTAIVQTRQDIGILDLLETSGVDLSFTEDDYNENSMYLLLLYAGARIFPNITVSDFLETDIYAQAMLLRVIWLNTLIANDAFSEFSPDEIEEYLELCQNEYIENKLTLLDSPLITNLESTQTVDVLAAAIIDLVRFYSRFPSDSADRINIQGAPLAAVCSRNGEFVYVASTESSTLNENGALSIIRTSDNVIVNTLSNMYSVEELCVSHDGNYIYATASVWGVDDINGAVLVISTRTNNVVRRIILGDYNVCPSSLCLDPSGSYLYVTDSRSGTVTIIDTVSRRPIHTYEICDSPAGISFAPDGEEYYVGGMEDQVVYVISAATNSIIRTIDIGSFADELCITPSGDFLYVSCQSQGVVTVRLSDGEVVESFSDIGACNVNMTPSGEYLYLSNLWSDTVTIIRVNDNKIIAIVDLMDDSFPKGICFSPDESVAYVACMNGGCISILE